MARSLLALCVCVSLAAALGSADSGAGDLPASPGFVVEEEGKGTSLLQVFRGLHQASRLGRPDDITLSLQADMSRIDRLLTLSKQWKGPINAGVLVRDSADLKALQDFCRSGHNSLKQHVTVHAARVHDDGPYPINSMRNVALGNINTDWVYILDIDENVVFDMATYRDAINKALSSDQSIRPTHTAFVATSWQWGKQKGKHPGSKAELVRQIELGHAIVKHSPLPGYWTPALPFDEWKVMTAPKRVPYHDRFEPYYIAQARNVPLFHEQFRGYGFNAAEQVFVLATKHFEFVVLPDVFNFADEENVFGRRVSPEMKALAQDFWRDVGVSLGCPECTYTDCTTACLSMFDPSRQALVALEAKPHARPPRQPSNALAPALVRKA